jgi:hypothetical protein
VRRGQRHGDTDHEAEDHDSGRHREDTPNGAAAPRSAQAVDAARSMQALR